MRLDFVGATLIAGTVTSLVLALQWGGNTKPWGDKAVIIVRTPLSLLHLPLPIQNTEAGIRFSVLCFRACLLFRLWFGRDIWGIMLWSRLPFLNHARCEFLSRLPWKLVFGV